MALNLEFKSKIGLFENIKNDLEGIGAYFRESLNQKDIYYKVKTGLLKLRIENGNYSLIRYNRDETNPDRWSNYFVVKLDGKETELMLESLFEIETEVIKQRELYFYKNTRVHLDIVENLGNFLELETIVDKSKEHAKENFNHIVGLLNLDLSNQIRLSYRDLMLRK